MRRRLPLLWSLPILSLFSACAASAGDDTGPAGDPCEEGADPTLQIGKGELGFESLEDDPMAELIHGPQGGYHVNLALHATYLNPGGQITLALDGFIDGENVADNSRYVQMRCNSAVPALQASGIYLIFDDGLEPEDLDGQTVQVEVSATDRKGSTVSDEATLTIFDLSLE